MWVLDALLYFPDEIEVKLRGPGAEIIRCYWGMLTFPGYLAPWGISGPFYFAGNKDRLLDLEKRLDGGRMGRKVIWASGEATMEIIAGIHWGNNQFARRAPCSIIQSFASREQGNKS